MNICDIESIISNIKYADNLYEDINVLKVKIEKLKKKHERKKEELDDLKFSRVFEQKTEIKKTFDEILDEICKCNNMRREDLFINFEEKVCIGYFFDDDETVMETILKEIDARGGFILDFSLASNKAAFEEDPLFCLYPITEDEIERREKVEKIRKEDSLYGEYRFDAKPFSPMSDGVMMYKRLDRKGGMFAEAKWLFDVNSTGKMYYYVNPKYIDIDDGSKFSNALKNLLTDYELEEYYNQKREYLNLLEKRQLEIKEREENIEKIENEISELETNLYKKTRQIKLLKWPVIKIRLGDFIEEVYKADDIFINSSNSDIKFYGLDFFGGRGIKEDSVDTFVFEVHEKVEQKKSWHNTYFEFGWKMPYSEIMYNGKSLYNCVKRNHFKSIKKLSKVKDFVIYFKPEYFFNFHSSLNKDMVRCTILKCISLEMARNGLAVNNIEDYYRKMFESKEENYECELENSYEPEIEISRDEILREVRKDCSYFKKIPREYREDREIVLEALIMDGLLLEFVSEDLKNDDVIVKTALKSNPLALEFASNKFKDDEKLILDIILKCAEAIKFTSPRIKDNKLIALETVKIDGRLIRYFPKFKTDREAVLEAVRQNGLALIYASEIFFSDKEIVMTAISQPQSTYLIAFVSDDLKADSDVMLPAIKNNRVYLKYASEDLKDEIRIEMVKAFTGNLLDENNCSKNKVKTRRHAKW